MSKLKCLGNRLESKKNYTEEIVSTNVWRRQIGHIYQGRIQRKYHSTIIGQHFYGRIKVGKMLIFQKLTYVQMSKLKCLGNRLEKGITCSKTIQNNVLLSFRMMFWLHRTLAFWIVSEVDSFRKHSCSYCHFHMILLQH
jgi:hypothetical protein